MDAMRPARLWRLMPSDLRQQAAAAFWNDDQASLEQAEAVGAIARQIKFRPRSVLSLSDEKRTRHLATLPQVSDLLAARLLVSYHLTHQRPMMGAFLDALGIAHDDGLIADESPSRPTTDQLDTAVQALGAAYPKADVARYFWTLLWQDSETWGGLEGRAALSFD